MLKDILEYTGTALRAAVVRHRVPADKMDLYNAVTDNITLLNGFLMLFENPEQTKALEMIQERLVNDRNGSTVDRDIGRLYRDYTLSLHGAARTNERDGFLNSMAEAARIWRSDHILIQRSFMKLFAMNTVTLENMRVSHAVLVGYTRVVEIAINWAIFMIGNTSLPTEIRPLGFQVKFLKDNAEIVADAVDMVSLRPRTANILSEIEAVKQTGHDVALMVGGVAIDTYADEENYPPEIKLGMDGFIRSLSTMISDRMALIQKEKHRRNQEMQSWMTQHLAMLRLQMANVDPESAEYQQQITVINAYLAQLSTLERKIADYEGRP